MEYNDGQRLKEWVRKHYRGKQSDFINMSGMSKSKIYNLFNQSSIDSLDKRDMVESIRDMLGTDALEELELIFGDNSVTQKNEQGGNYQRSTHNEAIGNELIELRIENKYLKDKIKTLEEMINILKSK